MSAAGDVLTTFAVVVLAALLLRAMILWRRRSERQAGRRGETPPIATAVAAGGSPQTPQRARAALVSVVLALTLLLGSALFMITQVKRGEEEPVVGESAAVGGGRDLSLALYGRPLRHADLSDEGEHLRALGDTIRQCDSVLAGDPSDPAASLTKARALRSMGLRVEAAAAYETAVRVAPSDATRYEYAVSLYECGEFDRASEVMQSARRPGGAAARAAYGHFLAAAGRRSEAEREYKLIIAEGGPDCADAFIGLGILSCEHADYASAASHFHAALRADSTAADAWNNLGVARAYAGDWDAAVECFERAASGNGLTVYVSNLAIAMENASRAQM